MTELIIIRITVAIMIAMISFRAGYFLGTGRYEFPFLRKKPKIPIRENHLPPEYYGYNDQFADNNICLDCGLIGLSEDLETCDCCPKCGGTVHIYFAGKWQEQDGFMQWVTLRNKQN